MSNIFAVSTLRYIWSHPNCKNQRIKSIFKFIGWQFYKRLTHKYLDIELISNIKIRCHPDSYSAAAALYCGLYDYDEMNFLLRYLRGSDSFLDIGSNVGIYTLLAASKIKSGLIYSFEALPKNYSRLTQNIELNQLQQVKPYAIAVSDFTGTTALNLAEGDSMPFMTDQVTDNTIKVPTDTLENLLKYESSANLTLAKIDIEGAEILAFKGAVSLLKKQRPYVWIMEINDAVNNFGLQKQDVVKFLQDYGYSLYQYDADTNQIHSITLAQQKGNNVLAIADSAIDFVRDRLNEKSLASSPV
ncbi:MULTISPECIES: FkbM family methyltransferase [Calothrix]|uniref:FkbM family methyltransferase n=2 Tax=Calothrix TaxID=1186 RepID=A0ABR8A218_9CYAN|nr:MULTISPECIES: FkbM family methyltransferase [Calothrix]MBD2193889.1 FkbM family methyltransferase [Calothrix parietina FACHB-288]MBD2222895.1 FkbM family methyltransferase [Calothrix anomala FACHB-343]